MLSTYRSIAGGLVRPPIGSNVLEVIAELTRLLDRMRSLATSHNSTVDQGRNGRVLNTAPTMHQAMRARVGTTESRLDSGLATALAHAYAPATDDEWDEYGGHMDEFRFDLG